MGQITLTESEYNFLIKCLIELDKQERSKIETLVKTYERDQKFYLETLHKQDIGFINEKLEKIRELRNTMFLQITDYNKGDKK